jgi:hypothetical protein
MKRFLFVSGVLISAAFAVSCSQKPAEKPAETPVAPPAAAPAAPAAGKKITPSAAVRQMAASPAGPAEAATKTSVGRGKLVTSTANSDSDTDASWVAAVDLDGDGDVEMVEWVWDDEDKVLYGYTEDDSALDDGTVATAMLFALYAPGNAGSMPTGSGWYVQAVGASDPKVTDVALWGCKFDAEGNATECGAATIDASKDAITVTAAM